jgi:hypothetical protein
MDNYGCGLRRDVIDFAVGQTILAPNPKTDPQP